MSFPLPPHPPHVQGKRATGDEPSPHVAPEDQPHPTKRVNRSDADASYCQPNPTSTSTPSSTSTSPMSTLTPLQKQLCTSALKIVRESSDAEPFLVPISTVIMYVPSYPDVVAHPMDLKTIQAKLENSLPRKGALDPSRPCYLSADQFIADAQLVFSNSLTFAGPESEMSRMGSRLRALFEKTMQGLPHTGVVELTEVKAAEVNFSLEQLKFCTALLVELHDPQHQGVASPFYDPVDWIHLNIPKYPRTIKEPMDLSTIRGTLAACEYPSAQALYNDFNKMIRSCYHWNPPGTPLWKIGQELQKLIEKRWKRLPQLKPHNRDDDMDIDGAYSYHGRKSIHEMEETIRAMRREHQQAMHPQVGFMRRS